MEDARLALRASLMSVDQETNVPEDVYFAELESTKGRFTGQTIDYRFPCTSSDDYTCQIAMHLSAFNEVFSYGAFHMRFEPGASGQFCILGLPACHAIPPCDRRINQHTQEVRNPSALLYWLLKTHHCVSALNITSPFLHRIDEELLNKAIVVSQSLKRLQLHLQDTKIPNKLSAAISALEMLEELQLNLYDCPVHLTIALAALLGATTSLTVLGLKFGQGLPEMHAMNICRALCTNKTLRELSLSGPIATAECLKVLSIFFRNSATLTTLSITFWDRGFQACLKDVLHVTLQNRMLTSLTLKGSIIFDDESAQLAAQILSAERRFRVFRVASHNRHSRNETGIFDSWLVSIEKNNTLEELGLPLSIWKLEQWKKFFAVISKATNLAKVYCSLWYLFPDNEQHSKLLLICRALGESGAAENVHLDNWHLPISLDALKCKAFSEVTLDSNGYLLGCCDVLQRLPSHGHITSVRIYFNPSKKEIAQAFANYVRDATALRSLELYVSTADEDSADISATWTLLFGSLSRNTSLKKLNVAFPNDTENQTLECLAAFISISRNIRRVIISGNTCVFVRRLSQAIVVDNYTLLEVALNYAAYFEDPYSWFVVSDRTRRNCDMVARAALCTNNSRSDRLHVSALERVHCYPALMEELAEVLGAPQRKVTRTVRAVLRCFEGLDVFMRLVGVVKEGVVCHPREDGCTQLADLHEHCWSHVRRYVILDDIK